jgi:hypothetical protein
VASNGVPRRRTPRGRTGGLSPKGFFPNWLGNEVRRVGTLLHDPRGKTGRLPSNGGFPHWLGNEVRRVGTHIHDASQWVGGEVSNAERGWQKLTSALGKAGTYAAKGIGYLQNPGRDVARSFQQASDALSGKPPR